MGNVSRAMKLARRVMGRVNFCFREMNVIRILGQIIEENSVCEKIWALKIFK